MVFEMPKEVENLKSIEEQMAEIRQRSSLYRERKQIRRLSVLASGIGILLAAVLVFVPRVSGEVGLSNSVLGSTILGPEMGGYVIVALLSFALGITITLIIQKYRKTGEGLSGTEKTGDK